MPDRTIKPGQERPGARRTRLIQTGADIATSWAGQERVVGPHDRPIDLMSSPYRCRGCNKVYDGGHVTVTARYADCSVWKCPHCGREHDSRHAWSGGPGERMGYVDIAAAERDGARLAAANGWTPRSRRG